MSRLNCIRSISALVLVLAGISCLRHPKDNNLNKHTEQFESILEVISSQRNDHQLEMTNIIVLNPNKPSVKSPPGFDSNYAAFANVIHTVDSFIPPMDGRLRSYANGKGNLDGFDAQVSATYGSTDVMFAMNYNGKGKKYREHVDEFLDELKGWDGKDGLYMYVKLTLLSDQLCLGLKENFMIMNSPKHLLYLKTACKEGTL